jgi:hypothetical protein
MNDICYDEPIADLFEADTPYPEASTQVRCGYLTLAASCHWNLLKLLGHVAPTDHLAPPAAGHDPTLIQLPYRNDSLTFHVKFAGISSDEWLEHASETPGLWSRAPRGDTTLSPVQGDVFANLLHTEEVSWATIG